MKHILTFSAPVLLFLSACGGGSSDLTSQAAIVNPLSGAEKGSVALTSDKPVSVSSPDDLLAINFSESEVGSSVQVSEGQLVGFSLTKTEAIFDKETATLLFPGSYEKLVNVTGDIQTNLEAAITLLNVQETVGVDESFTLNGIQAFLYETSKVLGTVRREQSYFGTETYDKGIQVYVETSQVGNKFSVAIGSSRYNQNAGTQDSYTPTSGEYSYSGLATAFGDGILHVGEAIVTINFDDLTGSLSASNFVPNLERSPETVQQTITVQSTLAIDSSKGTISSSAGTLSVDGTDTRLGVDGVISHDSSAVAGGLITEEINNGIIGGAFLTTKNPDTM